MHVGRGTNYSRYRSVEEWAAARLYREGWACRLAHRIGLQGLPELVEHEVELPTWPADAPELRIAFASDFHAGPTTPVPVLERACELLAAARPDVLLIGGDLVYLEARHAEPLAALLGAIPAPLGRYAVLGNHDLWADDARIARALERSGIDVLVNRSVRLGGAHEGVSVCGIDDPYTGRPDPDAAFREAKSLRIFLSHAPSGLTLLDRAHRFDLALCGHTHGGQVALPGGWPILVPKGPLSRTYHHGRFDLAHRGQGQLIVSRGVGAVGIPVRLFARSEVVLVRLRAAPRTP